MNLSFSEEDLKFQDEVRSFIADNYPAEIKNKMDKTSEIRAAAFVKDCSGGDRLMKLNTMEGRLLSRLTTLINKYLHYKNSKGKEIE